VLSSRGERQVQALIDGLARRRVSAVGVVSGTLRRQRDTAAPCAAALDCEHRVDARLDEYDDRDILGHYASVPVGLERRAGEEPLSSRDFQLILNEALRRWIAAGADSPCREPWPDFEARLASALDELAGTLGKGETALAVSSGGAIAAITASRLGLAPEALVAFNHVSINTGITKLTIGRGGTTLISVNEHAHLDEADPALISYR
jgi:broad specificity phosphatase PhoE